MTAGNNWNQGMQMVDELETVIQAKLLLISTTDLRDRVLFDFLRKLLRKGKPVFGIVNADMEKDYFSQVVLSTLPGFGDSMKIICCEKLMQLEIFARLEKISWSHQKEAIVSWLS